MLRHSDAIEEVGGAVVRQYKGTGTLRWESGNDSPCEFIVSQDQEGHLFVSVDIGGGFLHEMLNLVRFRLESELPDGRHLAIPQWVRPRAGSSGNSEGEHVTRMEGCVSDLDVCLDDSGEVFEYRYEILNLPCRKDFHLELYDRRRPLLLRYYPVEDVGGLTNWLSAVKGIVKTGELVVRAEADMDIEDLDDTVSRTCRLLSVASGTRVNWRTRKSVDEHGNVAREVHRERIQQPYTSMWPIDCRDVSVVRRVVEGGWRTLLDMEEQSSFIRLLDAWLDARSDVDFTESRGMKAAAALEMVKECYLEKHPADEFLLDITRSQRKKIASRARKAVRQEFGGDASSLSKFIGKINEHLFRRSFAEQLRSAAVLWDVDVNDEEIGRLVGNRNNILHTGSFQTTKESDAVDYSSTWRECTFIVGMLDRFVLRILNYEGEHFDWTQRRAEGAPKRTMGGASKSQ